MSLLSPLQPMGLRDLLDETFDLYKNHFVALVTATASVTLPIFVVGFILGSAPILGIVRPRLFSGGGRIFLSGVARAGADCPVRRDGKRGDPPLPVDSGAVRFPAGNPPPLSQRIVPFLKTMAVTLIAVLFCEILLAVVISIFSAFIVWLATLSVNIGPELVGDLTVALVSLFLVFFGSFLGFLFVFVMPVFTLEGLSGFRALKRGLRLYFVRPIHNGICLFLVAMLLLVACASVLGVLGLMTYALRDTSDASGADLASLAVFGLFIGLLQSTLFPAFVAATLLLYFDARIRTEGLDLHFLASCLEEAPVEPEETTPEVIWPRPAGIGALTLLMGLFNLTSFVFDYTEPERYGGLPDLALQIVFTAIGYAALWFFWEGRNWARLLVMLCSFIAIMEVVDLRQKLTWLHKADIVVEALVGAFLLAWLNAKPVAGYFQQEEKPESARSNLTVH